MQQLWLADARLPYLDERAYTGLEHHGGVEEVGAEQWLRVVGQPGDDARQEEVDVERVLHHGIQSGKDGIHERACQ